MTIEADEAEAAAAARNSKYSGNRATMATAEGCSIVAIHRRRPSRDALAANG
jgi:hypothetical protein